ncbi:type VI secretion system protein ImpA [Cribrihabitans marinus]|uniref:Type VI secretion system protein ImpA n=1 Tax=Cribrihabitans marinus TaxID=1227549 RepID=A0A1H7DUS5_9RHOB|nr:type VI secretion system protein TssA [Cribrihabitans marinus]SEK03432.1 type VI secretion system protein ImpA [Cribrihabitans marinus]
MDLAAYLDPRDANPPSGENLEYDPVFTELELTAQPGEERQMGDEVVAAEEPDWPEVEKLALAVLERSHDIRAAVFLSEAVLRTKGLPAFAGAVHYIRKLLEDFWDSCHPEPDEDDGDVTMRINAVQGLCGQPGGQAGPSAVYVGLRRVALTESRTFGRMSLRHVEVAQGAITPPSDFDSVPDNNAVQAAFKDTDAEVQQANADAIALLLEDVDAIDGIFSDKTPGEGPALDPLVMSLRGIKNALAKYGDGSAPAASAGDAAEGDAPAADAAGGGGAGGAPAPSGGGAINGPQDVTNTLERIMDYYARQEPSSPVPILLERAKRLVSADFLTIIEDMAKEGLDEVRKIGGIKGSDEYDY